MFTKNQTILALILVLIFGVFSACQEYKDGLTLRNDLLITVTPDQTTIPLYGYLRLIVTISNPSDTPVKAHKGMHYLQILWKHESMPKFTIFSPSWLPQASIPPYPPEDIISGTNLSTSFILSGISYNDKNPIFSIPGKYEIKASFLNVDGKTYWESDIVIIQVQEPSDDDKKAIKEIEENFKNQYDIYKWGLFSPLIESFRPKSEDIDLLTAIAKKYPQSSIGKAALCGKAFALSDGTENERKEAISILETLSNDQSTGFATDCRIKLAKLYMRFGEYKLAKVIVNQLVEDKKISEEEGEKILAPGKNQKEHLKKPNEPKDKHEGKDKDKKDDSKDKDNDKEDKQKHDSEQPRHKDSSEEKQPSKDK